jgi:3-deoxy-manno-octulosonate cytidylyltransferase (CMP-KDO synthetase)
MKSLIVIPARYNSTRLPGKPLLDIGGKTMIQRVWEQCVLSDSDEVVIATDSQLIYDNVSEYAKVVMTSPECESGTERAIEVHQKFSKYDIIINVQGDEPFIDPDDINLVINSAKLNPDKISTLVTTLNEQDALDRNCVKCICDYRDVCMFTRSPMYKSQKYTYKHIGIYGFSSKILETISTLDTKTINEEVDRLEQLRWLDNGLEMVISYTQNQSIGIDTPEDYNNALKLIK